MATAKTGYNQTDLNIDLAEERGLIHRDYIAHCFRWSHVMKHLKMGQRILDVGCGPQTPLAWTAYTNKFKPEMYVGLDIRPQTKDFAFNFPAKYIRRDITQWATFEAALTWFAPNGVEQWPSPHIITCFEVLEHMKHDIGIQVLNHIRNAAGPKTHVFISTPNYNGKDAAGNHTHSDGTIMEWAYDELESAMLSVGFKIEAVHGTFASQRDLKPIMDGCELDLMTRLKEYYDSNLLAIIFAPLHARQSRNCIWRLSIA